MLCFSTKKLQKPKKLVRVYVKLMSVSDGREAEDPYCL